MELGLLVGSTLVGMLALALACLAGGEPVAHSIRAASVGGGFIVAALLMDLLDSRRDHLLLPCAALLCCLSTAMLWRLGNAATGEHVEASSQVVWILLGAALMALVYYVIADVRSLVCLAHSAAFAALALIAVTMWLGVGADGSRLWLDLGFVKFQPTELAKVLTVIALAGYIGNLRNGRVAISRQTPAVELRFAVPTLLAVVFCLAIFVLQRDLGLALLFMGLFVAMIYLATGHKGYGVVGLALFIVGVPLAAVLVPAVGEQLNVWLSPWNAADGRGSLVREGMFALAAGGITGSGLGLGMADLIPAARGEFVFAAIAEELGLLGSVAVLLLYAFIATRAYQIAWAATDRFSALLAAGLATMFALQSIIVVAGIVRLIPPTGMMLPFLSYGGTSIVCNFIALGLLMVVARDAMPGRRASGPSAVREGRAG